MDLVQSTINIRSTLESTNNHINYYVRFNIVNQNCTIPRISIRFQDKNFVDDDTKFLNVYYNTELIAECVTNNDCNDTIDCLEDYLLSDTLITTDTQIVLNLQKSKDSINTYDCDIDYSLWADITLKCGDTPGLFAIVIYSFRSIDPYCFCCLQFM